MLKALVILPERAAEAVAAAERLVELSSEQLAVSQEIVKGLDLTGELPHALLKRLVRGQSEIRKVRASFKSFATPNN